MSKIIELDAETNIVTERTATKAEIDSMSVAPIIDVEAMAAQKAAARSAALEKLAELGLTEEMVAAL